MAPPPATTPSFLRPPPLPHHAHARLLYRPPSASFRVAEILGGRGLCNGEVGVRKELASGSSTTSSPAAPSPSPSAESSPPAVDPDAFEKEMMGLTGGFPGGEVGLKDFVAKNPPPPPSKKSSSASSQPQAATLSAAPPRPPELPLFLPGMVVLVKNPNNAYHMYCGIVQRVTDGKVAVLFEGGNWDRLITFNLDELEGRDKGPPMVNPKSVVLEALVAELEGDDGKEEEEAVKKEKEPEGTAAAV
ncbi:hypothetical protein BS78_K094800 [Paspalum vaginatum]|uniref:NAD(P)H-quinone oxidoreductase subunit S, chloroplastic n=1 Tax=Paspalum vaginatum TaxID=158149 RepID=A0A9W7XD07_9POAL|nr:hypothetical protein BS78_K094800 [Paspalum vaginatum]